MHVSYPWFDEKIFQIRAFLGDRENHIQSSFPHFVSVLTLDILSMAVTLFSIHPGVSRVLVLCNMCNWVTNILIRKRDNALHGFPPKQFLHFDSPRAFTMQVQNRKQVAALISKYFDLSLITNDYELTTSCLILSLPFPDFFLHIWKHDLLIM